MFSKYSVAFFTPSSLLIFGPLRFFPLGVMTCLTYIRVNFEHTHIYMYISRRAKVEELENGVPVAGDGPPLERAPAMRP